MAGSPEQCKTLMRRLLSACVESGFVVEADCDEVMQQFDDLIHTCANGEFWNTFLLPMTALTHSFVAEWQLTILRHGQFVS